jgi:putative membrane protein
MGSGGMNMMLIFWLFILVVFFIFLLWLGRRKKSCFTGPPDPPLDILKRRYARGEISKDEFDRIKMDLES